jgi:hypothetical protein
MASQRAALEPCMVEGVAHRAMARMATLRIRVDAAYVSSDANTAASNITCVAVTASHPDLKDTRINITECRQACSKGSRDQVTVWDRSGEPCIPPKLAHTGLGLHAPRRWGWGCPHRAATGGPVLVRRRVAARRRGTSWCAPGCGPRATPWPTAGRRTPPPRRCEQPPQRQSSARSVTRSVRVWRGASTAPTRPPHVHRRATSMHDTPEVHGQWCWVLTRRARAAKHFDVGKQSRRLHRVCGLTFRRRLCHRCGVP